MCDQMKNSTLAYYITIHNPYYTNTCTQVHDEVSISDQVEIYQLFEFYPEKNIRKVQIRKNAKKTSKKDFGASPFQEFTKCSKRRRRQ